MTDRRVDLDEMGRLGARPALSRRLPYPVVGHARDLRPEHAPAGGKRLRIEPRGARLGGRDGGGVDPARPALRWEQTASDYRFEPARGKGSHGRLWVGDRFTTVRHGELKPGTFRNMLRQLEIVKESF